MSKKIVLLGYMGSGKTVIAKKLSEKLDIKCFDLDDIVEKKENSSIESVFKNKGELYFRKLENKIFIDFMNADEDFILSLGGGTPCYFDHHLLLQKADVVSLYLKASIETLSERLFSEKEKRPLISHLNNLELKEFIAKHLFERGFFYNQASNIIVVDKKSINQIVEEIKAILT
jgi:shikimate kinase